MIAVGNAVIRKVRAEVRAAAADRHGCIRIRRSDLLDLLDLVAALDAALTDARRQAPTPRFAERFRAQGSVPAASSRRG